VWRIYSSDTNLTDTPRLARLSRMADEDEPLIKLLIDRMGGMVNLLLEHQAYILALVEFQAEQSSYDRARFKALHDKQRKMLEQPKDDARSAEEIALALLREFKGPIQ
jgi:hypothetical protein